MIGITDGEAGKDKIRMWVKASRRPGGGEAGEEGSGTVRTTHWHEERSPDRLCVA